MQLAEAACIPANVEFFEKAAACSGAQPMAQVLVVNHPHERGGKCFHITGGHQYARDLGFDDFRMRADRGRDHSEAVREAFENGHCQALGMRRQHQDVRVSA